MATTNRDVINQSMGLSQDPNYDDIQSAMGGSQAGGPAVIIPVSISGTPPTSGQVGQAYSFMPTTSNGSGARTYSLAGGTLLSGLLLGTSTGAITGTPTVAGSITGLSVRVTDATGSAATLPTDVVIAADSSQPIVVSPRMAAYADSFEGDGALNTRPNWVLPAGDNTRWITSAGSVKYNQLYGGNSRAVFGGDVADQEVRFEYNTSGDGDSPWDTERQAYYLWYKDDSNYVTFTFPAGAPTVRIVPTVAGTDGPTTIFNRPTGSATRTQGVLTFKLANGQIRLAFDGLWATTIQGRLNFPLDRANLSDIGIPPAARSGKFSLTANTFRYPRSDGVSVYSNQITLDTDDEFVGRDSTTATGGTWTGTGTFSGFTYDRAAVRVLDQATGAAAVDWAAPKSVTASGGTYTMQVLLPTGGAYIVETALIGTDGLARIARSRPVLSGYHIVYYGQSNSVYRAGVYDAAVRGTRYANFVSAAAAQDNNFPSGHWASLLTDFRPSACVGTARTAAPLLNVPVAVTAGGVAATDINFLSPGGGGWDTFLTQISTLKGIIEAVIWDQGEADADGAAFNTGYVAKFRDVLLPALRTRAGNPNMPVLLAPPGNYPDPVLPNSSVSSRAALDSQREMLRQALQTLVDTVPGVSHGGFKLGADHKTDAYHYALSAYDSVLGGREGLSVAKALGASTYDGRGPQITGATRSGATITLAIGLNGATSIAGPVTYDTFTGTRVAAPTNSFKGYEVSADDFATNLPINGIAVSGGNLVITLASAPSGAVKVRSFAGANYDDTSLFVGQYDGGLTIPVAPIIKYLTA